MSVFLILMERWTFISLKMMNTSVVLHVIIGNTMNKSEDRFQVSVNKLSTLMAKNHHKQIDLLKMDKEGSEYVVINDLIEENLPVTQICIESHHCFKGIGLQKTMVAVESLRALIRMVSILLRSLIQKKNIRSFIDESPIS